MSYSCPGNLNYQKGGPETAGGDNDDDWLSSDDNSSYFGANQSIRSKSLLKSEITSEIGHGT